jgi:hypothetical protein
LTPREGGRYSFWNRKKKSPGDFRLMRRLLLALRATRGALSYAAGIAEKLRTTHKDVQAGAMQEQLGLEP